MSCNIIVTESVYICTENCTQLTRQLAKKIRQSTISFDWNWSQLQQQWNIYNASFLKCIQLFIIFGKILREKSSINLPRISRKETYMEAWNNKSSWTSVKRLLWIEKDQSYGNEMTKMKRLAKERRFLLISMMKMRRARWTGHSLWGFELSWIILKMNFVHGAVSLCIYVRIWGWYLKKKQRTSAAW